MKNQNIFKTLAAVFAILCSFGANTAFAQCNASLFAGGAGTEANPYQISTPEQLQNLNQCLGDSYRNNYYVLNNDIDLTSYLSGAGNDGGAGWVPIGGNSNNSFSGEFNGNGHKVSGLWLNRPSTDYVGLFGFAHSEIRNIGVEIDDSKGGVKGGSDVGGLVGLNGGTVSNSYATGSVTGSSYVGGLVGGNSTVNAIISNSYATGSVTGSVTGTGNYRDVGGLVGFNGGTVSNSYATGSVTGSSYVGGLVGRNYGTNTISNSYYDKQTTGQTDTGKGTGKTTAEMKTKSTYEGWDFEVIWEINSARNNGYPTLFWQNQNHIWNAIVAIPNQTWTGNPITPKPSVSFKGSLLTEGTHFTYSYDNNTQIGTAILRIVGKGTYSGQAKIVEFSIVAAACGTGFAGGTGTEADPYKIADAKNLDAIRNCLGDSYSSKYYELQSDINVGSYIANTSAGWQPINSKSNSFSGKFNGNGHKVSGLWINRPSTNYVGLFGYAYGSEIRNIGVEIDDSKGGVKGGSYVGGLVGSNYDGTVSNSYATGSVTGTGTGSSSIYVGGLVGSNYGTISNSYATGSVTGTGNYSSVGGLVGYNNSSSTISNSYYDKQTTGQTDTGKGTGKTTAEMKTKSTYEGWDFEAIWEINSARNNGYPTLFWQNQNHFGNAIVSAIPNQTWTGNPITPKPSVSFKGSHLTEGTHFAYSYDNNTQTGTATLRIVGKGTYSGQAKIVEFSIVAAACGTGFAGGTGTEADPYKIADAKNLDAISNCLGDSYSGKYYELQSDINVGSYIANTSAGWQPIGNIGDNYSFRGKFNGNGHKVSGLWLNRPSTNYVGLFGYTTAEISNIGVEIDDSKGGVVGNSNVGGLVGSGGTVSNSYATGSVTGTGSNSSVGGLVGGNSGTVSNSYATGSVTGTGNNSYVGGLVGENSGYYGTVSNSYATGSVTGTGNYSSVGGLVGENSRYGTPTISNSYATGSVTGTGSNSYVGGLVGSNYGTVSNSYATGSVTGNSSVGGLVGLYGYGTVSNSYYDRQTSGQTDTGKGTGKTTAEMKTQNTYEGWDFAGTWTIVNIINNGYPTLQSQNIAIASYIPPQPYTRSATEPAFTVKFNGTTLTKGTDYTFSYSNNTKAGTAKITITCKGTYEFLGSTEAHFTITPKPLTITGVTALSREDNGTTAIELTGGTLNGVLSGDNVGFTLGTGTVEYPDAGSNKAVATNITLTGADASNYTLTQPTNITVEIKASTPIFPTAKPLIIAQIKVSTTANAITLENLPSNAKVEVYNLHGKQIYSANSGNSQILRIAVQTKGMYIVKAGSQTVRVVVR